MDSRPYTVHIYEDIASRISKWTLQYPNIETGGDIFGLWLNENEVVIQAVLGPGQNCRRTATSFFQDEQYLSRVGGLLTNSQGLCNVGSWHSHHTMNLPEPSRGDKDTVWRHLPTPGRFLLLIATIESRRDGPKVQMSFNLFESTNKGNEVARMNCDILKGRSPIRANEALNGQMFIGAEVYSKQTPYPEPSVPSGLNEPTKYRDLQVEANPGHRRQESSRNRKSERGHSGMDRRDQNVTCDGASCVRPLYHAAKNEFYFIWENIPGRDGRQRRVFYHLKHEIGRCIFCKNPELYKNSDGTISIFVERSRPQYYDHDEDQDCNCIIL